MSELIKYDFPVMEDVYGRFVTISGQVADAVHSLQGQLQTSTASWIATSREAWSSAQTQWNGAIGEMHTTLTALGNVINTAKENALATEITNTKAWPV